MAFENHAVSVVRSVADLRSAIADWRRAGETVALTPTMGALHAGHLSLIHAARERASRTVATLFVNPKQFGPNEDFAVYPREELKDFAKFSAAGVDLIFAPGIEAMYPNGFATQVRVAGLGDRFEGEHRPGFFTGVATVVSKLLLQALPDAALFGEKDYQQLQVIKRMTADLDIPVEIVGVETMREDDGLALSSRNAYLSGEERAAAPALKRALDGVAQRLRDGAAAPDAIDAETAILQSAGFASVDYLAAVDAASLEPVADMAALEGRPGRVLAAARLGKTRLIDNVPIV